MSRNIRKADSNIINRQAATALLTTTLVFLRKNRISKKLVLDTMHQSYGSRRPTSKLAKYRNSIKAYEAMGIVLSTWFSAQEFLTAASEPAPLTIGRGRYSVANLLKTSKVSVTPAEALKLMRKSLSVEFDATGRITPLRREFVLPDFEIPRAALVIERYLDTLSRNASATKSRSVLLLERNCHVPAVDLRNIAPVLRDIKGRGSAFIHAIDGDIEGKRTRTARNAKMGEMSVHIFAWTRQSRRQKGKVRPRQLATGKS